MKVLKITLLWMKIVSLCDALIGFFPPLNVSIAAAKTDGFYFSAKNKSRSCMCSLCYCCSK